MNQRQQARDLEVLGNMPFRGLVDQLVEYCGVFNKGIWKGKNATLPQTIRRFLSLESG